VAMKKGAGSCPPMSNVRERTYHFVPTKKRGGCAKEYKNKKKYCRYGIEPLPYTRLVGDIASQEKRHSSYTFYIFTPSPT